MLPVLSQRLRTKPRNSNITAQPVCHSGDSANFLEKFARAPCALTLPCESQGCLRSTYAGRAGRVVFQSCRAPKLLGSLNSCHRSVSGYRHAYQRRKTLFHHQTLILVLIQNHCIAFSVINSRSRIAVHEFPASLSCAVAASGHHAFIIEKPSDVFRQPFTGE